MHREAYLKFGSPLNPPALEDLEQLGEAIDSSSPSPPEILAYHGWGFDATCWQKWQTHLSQQGYDWKSFDRGYFGHPVQPDFSASASTKMIFVHSYGLHLCPIEQLKKADRIIIFSSFLNFHPESPSLRKRSQQMVQRMIEQFAIDPVLVLKNFWQKCGLSEGPFHPLRMGDLEIADGFPESRGMSLNTDLLLQDLRQLNVAEFDRSHFASIPQVLLLHGTQDRIVAAQRSQGLIDRQDQYYEIAAAGHALPFTHLETCWEWLQSLLMREMAG